ncbi:hypothetical protein [Desulfoferrobacter suflitae]|uniref:hypothetical protein n=1 Tax=Desulfoferrobacter suflitae TaxID=2865782 RepID=UPI0021641BCE|nr:hypothetical protein [Desulfoferrobacter suflitae]MCK8601519.1 hypothetical protein [Desulfoferrobacter suflitae]
MRRLGWVIAIGLAFCATACAPKTEDKTVSSKEVVEQTQKALDTLQKYFKEQQVVHLKGAEARLDLLGRRIAILQARAEKMGEEAKSKFETQVAAFKAKEEAARKKFAEMLAAKDGEWEKMAAGIRTLTNDLENEFNKILEKL